MTRDTATLVAYTLEYNRTYGMGHTGCNGGRMDEGPDQRPVTEWQPRRCQNGKCDRLLLQNGSRRIAAGYDSTGDSAGGWQKLEAPLPLSGPFLG